ncbi:MAG: ATP-dependent helicase, partial [Ilumatobacteraceae bacterium]
MDPQRLLDGLDADQRNAVTTTAMPLAIIAAAGSGKTTVLIRRIAHRILTGDAEPKHTLALTFTRDAAGELKRRLRRLDLRDPIEAGTFHSVALRLLRDRALTRHETMPQIATDRIRLMRECMTELRLDVPPFQALADVDWARARLVDAADYEAACRRERRRSTVPVSKLTDVAAAYERLKKRRGVIDFDDLLERTLGAMRSDPVFAEAVGWRFRHFYVDEAQDLNPLQHALLESWRNGRPDICLVGDPRQAIYGWNGADHTTLAEVEVRYPGVTVLTLTTNYRCTPQVVRAGAAALAAGGLDDDTRSDRPDGLAIAVREFATDADEALGVARQVRSVLNHRAGSDIAVLARTNDQLTELQRALAAAGVPTERAVGRSALEVTLTEAYRAGGREQLATWVDSMFEDTDPLRRRVAEEVDRYLTSGEHGGFRTWVESHSPFDDLAVPSRD